MYSKLHFRQSFFLTVSALEKVFVQLIFLRSRLNFASISVTVAIWGL